MDTRLGHGKLSLYTQRSLFSMFLVFFVAIGVMSLSGVPLGRMDSEGISTGCQSPVQCKQLPKEKLHPFQLIAA